MGMGAVWGRMVGATSVAEVKRGLWLSARKERRARRGVRVAVGAQRFGSWEQMGVGMGGGCGGVVPCVRVSALAKRGGGLRKRWNKQERTAHARVEPWLRGYCGRTQGGKSTIGQLNTVIGVCTVGEREGKGSVLSGGRVGV